MQNRSFFATRILAVSCLLILPIHSVAASAAKASATTAAPEKTVPAGQAERAVPLNQKDIHAAYNEGDFDKVTALIDGFNKSNKTYSRADSIFIAKHLAVVYSANPQTREKGRYFMYRLLEMMPSAELVDMFVSDEIDRIFDKVRKEFIARQKGFGVDSTQISTAGKGRHRFFGHGRQYRQAGPRGRRAFQRIHRRVPFGQAAGLEENGFLDRGRSRTRRRGHGRLFHLHPGRADRQDHRNPFFRAGPLSPCANY